MITLFHKPNTRSARFVFLLEELEAPYRLKEVATRNADGTGGADPANPHPHGKVPAISDEPWLAVVPDVARDQQPVLIAIAVVLVGGGLGCLAGAGLLARRRTFV